LEYLGRYTHRVAISNNRLLGIEDGQVRFRWKDYRNGNQRKTMSLLAEEFIRRFLLHVLPDRLHRIRYYGFLGNRHRQEKLAQCRALLGSAIATEPNTAAPEHLEDYRDRCEQLTGIWLRKCPVCGQGRMVEVELLPAVPAFMDSS
jgi:hypothetical protein